ncbi:hypothetical protein I1A62_03055 (plasmid) [Rhodococcus sp. USK10]|uniref:molybdopterin dinucleotide binding domain-containing protein n=1 Tax=Rhodococcus sp. USK10 TaxID=2789739 RepID=UPI001C5F0A0B|nr:molybdopterin dinucleotide binding domain-containing protein [Rhodococcus sp. USK10]QYB00094.1 hypothetical protein I1A62_03055 [Rhodococcus sp. USK10]
MIRTTRLLEVQPGDPDVLDRLDIGNGLMLTQLAGHAGVVEVPRSDRPYRLLCRRHLHVYNSSCNVTRTHRGVPYNPAYLHPDDMTELGLSDGTLVRISSDLSSITAVAMEDPALRTGMVSMAFGYGPTDHDEEVRTVGSSPSRLVSISEKFDRFTGQPRMTNIPVSIERIDPQCRT